MKYIYKIIDSAVKWITPAVIVIHTGNFNFGWLYLIVLLSLTSDNE